MQCAEVREMLPAYLKDGEASLAVRRHLGRCGDCKAELARYESLMEGLRALEAVGHEPPPGLASALARIPAQAKRLDPIRHHVVRNRAAYVGGAAVALVGAAGAALWVRRRLSTAEARA